MPLLAVAEAWHGLCWHGYDYDWSTYFDYNKAKELAKVWPLVLVALSGMTCCSCPTFCSVV
jgi:hypothetical protein